MCRIVLLFAMLLLSSCFTYYNHAEEHYFFGFLDGEKAKVERYDLIYLFDGDTVSVLNYPHFFDSQFKLSADGHIKRYNNGFCNVSVSAGDYFGCPHKLRGTVNVEIFLRNNKTGNCYLLAQKTVVMDAYRRVLLITQVYIGSDFERYETRSEYNIDWNKINQLALKDEKDTIYHYTVKYWEKREKNEDYLGRIDEKYFVEVP